VVQQAPRGVDRGEGVSPSKEGAVLIVIDRFFGICR